MSCGSGIYSLCILQGTTYSRNFLFTDDENDTPVDISAWSGIAPIRAAYGHPTILNSFILDFSAGVSGVLNLSMHRTGTAALPIGEHRYEVELYPSSSEAIRYLWGYAEVAPETST